MSSSGGFRELAHTADWEMEAWAPDLAALIETCARGMYSLSGTRLADGPRAGWTIDLRALDAESLLVRFLTELLWLGQRDGVAFDKFGIDLDGEEALHADMEGAPIAGLDKEIKAVTYHNLAVKHTERGLVVQIVFDV